MASTAPLILLKLVRSINKLHIISFIVYCMTDCVLTDLPSSDSGASPEIMVPQYVDGVRMVRNPRPCNQRCRCNNKLLS